MTTPTAKDKLFAFAAEGLRDLMHGDSTTKEFETLFEEQARELKIGGDAQRTIMEQARAATNFSLRDPQTDPDLVVRPLPVERNGQGKPQPQDIDGEDEVAKDLARTAAGMNYLNRMKAGGFRDEHDYHAAVRNHVTGETDPAKQEHARTISIIESGFGVSLDYSGTWQNNRVCPACRQQTGAVRVSESGEVNLKCHGKPGCSTEAIIAALGLTAADLSVPRKNGKARPTEQAATCKPITEKSKACVANELVLAPKAQIMDMAIPPAYSVNSYRVTMLMFAQVYASEAQTFSPLTFTPAELSRAIGLRHRLTIEATKHLVWELGGLASLMRVGSKWIATAWFDHPEYDDKTGLVTLRLHDSLLPYLTNLKDHYAAIPVKDSMRLTEPTHIKLFWVVASFLKFQYRQVHRVPVQDLIAALHLPKQVAKRYRGNWGMFKRDLMEPAREAIQKYTSVRFDYIGTRVNPNDKVGPVQGVDFFNVKEIRTLDGEAERVGDSEQAEDTDGGQ